MILHPDGRVEGTPEEIAAYQHALCPDVSDLHSGTVFEGVTKPEMMELYATTAKEKLKKPPLGLLPKWLWDESRLAEVEAAIQRFKDEGMTVPMAFTDEAYRLRQSISFSKSNSQSL